MKISNLKFTITDKTKSLIPCEFNWKGLFEVNMRYDYFDGYYKKEMKVDITKEFETHAEAKEYIADNS